MFQLMRELLGRSGVHPEFTVTDDAGQPVVGVETHSFRNGAVEIVGLLTNPQLRVDEMGPPQFKSNERFEHARKLVHATDLQQAMQIQSEFLRSQFTNAGEHMRQITGGIMSAAKDKDKL